MSKKARRTILIVLGIVGVLMIAAIAAVTVFWIEMDKGQGAPPPIAEGAMDFGQPSLAWSQRLETTFPKGVSETSVRERLGAEGFDVQPTSPHASYGWGNGLPCIYSLTVDWTAEDGTLTSISGDYTNACL